MEADKKWKKKGWGIAMHGYKHEYHEVERRKNIFPFYNKSEFTQLSLEKQKMKLKNSISIFHENGVDPKIWVAPGHCFDQITLQALKTETSIRIISDGISFFPYTYKDFLFIPQQLWSIKQKSFGYWTICLHPDTMSEVDIKKFSKDIGKTSKKFEFISWTNLQSLKINNHFLNAFFSKLFWLKYDLRHFYQKIILKND